MSKHLADQSELRFNASNRNLKKLNEQTQLIKAEIESIRKRFMIKIMSGEAVTPSEISLFSAEIANCLLQFESVLTEAEITSHSLRVENSFAFSIAHEFMLDSDKSVSEIGNCRIKPLKNMPCNAAHKNSVIFIFSVDDESNSSENISFMHKLDVLQFYFNVFFNKNLTLYQCEKNTYIIGLVNDNTSLFFISKTLAKVNLEISEFSEPIGFTISYANNAPLQVIVEEMIASHENINNNLLKNGFINTYNFELDDLQMNNAQKM
jgi:hypothetical protein